MVLIILKNLVECASAADCSNVGADGCPPMSHPICDMMHKVCQCFGPPVSKI